MRSWRHLTVATLTLGATAASFAQEPGDLLSERQAFARWLTTSAWSPLRAVAHAPIGPRLTIGPKDADVLLSSAPSAVLTERDSRITLTVAGTDRPIGPDGSADLGSYRLRLAGPRGRETVTVYGQTAVQAKPEYFPYQASLRQEVVLSRPRAPTRVRMLAPEGAEVEAREAGTVDATIAGETTTLRAIEMPARGDAPAEIVIFFRDQTADAETYPAGRFVALLPVDGNRYLLDFNRSRNPFCAYNTVIPCPAPWRGNTIPTAVRAGERYSDSGGSTPPAARP
ncbi:MAG: DUF1684 domain-containing protein [Gemmatimonadales bacterium]